MAQPIVKVFFYELKLLYSNTFLLVDYILCKLSQSELCRQGLRTDNKILSTTTMKCNFYIQPSNQPSNTFLMLYAGTRSESDSVHPRTFKC